MSSFCAGNACVGVETSAEGVEVVDTKLAHGPRLSFTLDEWAAFVAGVKAGEFDTHPRGGCDG